MTSAGACAALLALAAALALPPLSRAAPATATAGALQQQHPLPEHVHRMGANKLDMRYWLQQTQAYYKAEGITVPAQCEDDFGVPYIDKWLSAKSAVCTGGKSSLTCYKHQPAISGKESGGIFCYADNLVLDSADFLGDEIMAAAAPKRLRDLRQGPGSKFPSPKKGA